MPQTTMKMPALAVVGADHRIIRSTETFRRRYEDAETLCEQAPEIDLVLTGRADVATVNLGNLSVEVEAVTDASGRRQAMLTLPPSEPSPVPEPPVTALRDAAEESRAIVWVKDLEGRYLYANPRFVSDLGTSDERLRGHTDADLPEAGTVDGPRLRYAEDGLEEPLQLEYTVPAIDLRPALAAFRFALRDDNGRPVATCGVATPVNEANVARDEAVRLMQLERWNRLDPADVRAELLEQWHVQAAPARVETADSEEPQSAAEAPDQISRPDEHPAAPMPAPPPAPAAPSLSDPAELLQKDLQLTRKWADRADHLQGELQEAQARIRQAEQDAQQALSAAARATEEADRWRSEAESLRGPSVAALRLSEELGRALAAERERGDELARTLGRLRARLTDFESAFERGYSSTPRSASSASSASSHAQ